VASVRTIALNLPEEFWHRDSGAIRRRIKVSAPRRTFDQRICIRPEIVALDYRGTYSGWISLLKFLEKPVVHFVCGAWRQPKFELFEQIDNCTTVYQLNRLGTVSDRFRLGV
jgi:hypothetical protein